MNYSDILSTIRTTEEAREFEEEIALLLQSQFKVGKQRFASILSTEVRATTSSIIAKLPVSGRKQFLEDLHKKLQERKVLRLTLAFEPSEAIIEAISAWVRENLGQEWVLSLSCDPSIVGGCVIEKEGKYMDYSVRRKLDL